MRQRRVVDESVGNHDSYNSRSRAGGVYSEELRRDPKAIDMNVERLRVKWGRVLDDIKKRKMDGSKIIMEVMVVDRSR